MISKEEFIRLGSAEIASLVRQAGPKVCVFPINGTRRWFVLEHTANIQGDPIQAYMDISSRNHIELYKLFFAHGVDTLLTPEFGPDLLLRGDEYVQRIGADGLARLASHPLFVDFYMEYGVRVHFYGEHRRFLAPTPYAYLSDLFDQASEQTRQNTKHRLFIGVFGADATQTVSEFSVEFHQNTGRLPSKSEIVAKYYGEDIPKVDFFIGFDKFSAFDYPLLSSGEEDLYFSVAPSPYMSPAQLRAILYDHLYTRRELELDYEKMSPAELGWIKQFYAQNIDEALGIGITKAGIWIPASKLSMPG